MEAFLEPVSVRSLADVMGVGDFDDETLRRWFADLAVGGANFEQDPAKYAISDRTAAEIDHRLGPVLDRLEREPDGSVLSRMLHAPDGPAPRAEVLSNLKLILLGGMQEPGHGAGNTLWAILSQPAARERLLADPDLAGAALDEGMRWLSPVGTTTREVVHAVSLAGVEIPAGERVATILSSANRDASRWERADEFDIDRPRKAHRAFGTGPHFCAGHWLAGYEQRIPLRMLFERLPISGSTPGRPSRSRAGSSAARAACRSSGTPEHGPDVRRGRGRLPGRAARVAGRESAGGRARRRRRRALRLAARLPAPAGRGRLRRGPLAARVRRARSEPDGVGDLLRGARPLGRAAARERARHPARRPHDHDLGHRGAEGAPPGADPDRRGDLVPGLLRARRRLGPREPQDPGRQGRRRVGGQRPEGLDVGRPVLEMVHARRPHGPRRTQAQGPDLLHAGHGAAGRDGRAAAADDRRARVQRAVHRRRAHLRRAACSAVSGTAGRWR